MLTVALALGVTLVICGGFSAAVAAWRLIPRPAPTKGEREAHERIDELERALVDFEERHASLRASANSTIGKLRRKVRQLQDEGDDEDEDADSAELDAHQRASELPDRPLSKAELFQLAGRRR